MASIKYTGIVSGIKGSIAGTTFQKGNVVNIVRSKIVNRLNFSRKLIYASNQTNQANLAAVSQYWRILNPTEQLAYATIAPSFPFVNRFGDSYTPTAYQLFVYQNLNLLSVGKPMSNTAPTVIAFPSLAGLTLVVDTTTNYTFSWMDNLTTDYRLKIYGASGVSSGKSVNKSALKYGGHKTLSGVNTVNVFSDYSTAFGAPVAARKYFAAVKLVHSITGISTPFLYCNAICP